MTEPIKVGDLEITPHPEGWLKPIHPALGIIDETAYVGVWIPSIAKNREGLETEKFLLYIITDRREQVLANDEVLKAKGWRLQYKPILFENRWKLEDVEAYVNGSGGLCPSPSEIFNRVMEAWKTYIWFPDPREYVFQALWVVGTYFHHLFSAYPYPYLGGVKRTAKTKVLTIHSCLAFNAIFSMNMSTASLYRLIQNARCTVLVDESEKLSNPERAQEFRSILLAGYKQGQKVYRVEKTKKEQLVPEAFEVYSPKALANIRGLEDVLEDRCKVTIMQRSRDRSIVDREVNIAAQSWSDLRAILYRLYLAHWKEVKQFYDKLGELSERGELVNFLRVHAPGVSDQELELLSSRELELWRPIFALSLFFDEYASVVSEVSAVSVYTGRKSQREDNGLPIYTQTAQTALTTPILKLAIDTAKARHTDDVTESAETVLVEVLCKLVREDGYYKVKAILDAMKESYGEEDRWLNTKWVGRCLKRLGFQEKRRVGAGIEYLFKKKDIEDLASRIQIGIPKTDETKPKDLHDESPGTREKFDVILRIVAKLEDKSGSANMEELECLAEKEGIDKSNFVRILATMLREGLLYHPDEQSVKAARRSGSG